ncbi:DUF692 domain-containing protein [Sorangium sp. So ce1151]|uniref:DUF692 domain-containing protein n=1 Tax=Sorangium sp. So ce1151 TaxID=3133332 RepID=UPI003F5F1180
MSLHHLDPSDSRGPPRTDAIRHLDPGRRTGFGLGLRPKHFGDALAGGLAVDCVEIIAENFVGRGGRPRAALDRVRRGASVLVHAVGMDVAGFDPIDMGHVLGIRDLADEIEADLVSDHLCFSRLGGRHGHDLWPVPRTVETLERVAARICRIQDALGRRIALENVAAYVDFASNEMTELDVWLELFSRTDCLMLLDLNNAYVSSVNLGGHPGDLIEGLPEERVVQIHLAGHSELGAGLLDDHGSPVADEVWRLYERAVRRFGPVTTIVERDAEVPPLDVLLAEVAQARSIARAS